MTTALLERLESVIRAQSSALIAYSGGIDSALLAVVAHRVLGIKMLAVLSTSASLAPIERESALRFAAEQGFPCRPIMTGELENASYVENSPDRCYHCKSELFTALNAIARAEGFDVVYAGTNTDDLGDYRPGLQAARELGVRSPYVEAGMGKAEIRAVAQSLGLPNWDKPAAACLASRLPYGTQVTIEVLDQVGRAELILLKCGLSGARLRHHGDIARIEIHPEQFATALTHRQYLTSELKGLGYHFVTLDLEGYRVGSLNEVLRA